MNFNDIEFFLYIGLFFVLFSIIPSISITVRRLHDLNYSGWWVWFIYLLSIIGFVFFEPYIFLFNTIIDTPLFIFRGNSGANRYGEPPSYD